MPEGENVGLAHDLSGQDSPVGEHRVWEELIEIAEVIVLAIVAVATAWSGFQAAKWDGRQSALYATVNNYGFQADAAATAGGQELSADAALFTAWLQAASAHNSTLAAVYVRRFTPAYHAAFAAWLRTDPLANPAAPPGPAAMPQYRNPGLAAAERLRVQASAAFARGSAARDTSERYLRGTVLFALVLFLVAIAQRFKLRAMRFATTGVAIGMLIYAGIWVAQLPRALRAAVLASEGRRGTRRAAAARVHQIGTARPRHTDQMCALGCSSRTSPACSSLTLGESTPHGCPAQARGTGQGCHGRNAPPDHKWEGSTQLFRWRGRTPLPSNVGPEPTGRAVRRRQPIRGG